MVYNIGSLNKSKLNRNIDIAAAEGRYQFCFKWNTCIFLDLPKNVGQVCVKYPGPRVSGFHNIKFFEDVFNSKPHIKQH